MLSKKEIIDILVEEDENSDREIRYSGSFERNGYTFKNEERHGGCEGGGDEHWVVFSVRKGDQLPVTYWEVPGWYASHDGAYLEFENLFQVEPKEIVKTIWAAVK